MKRCTGCGEEKDLEAFAKHGRSLDGRQNWCRYCFRANRLNRPSQSLEARVRDLERALRLVLECREPKCWLGAECVQALQRVL